MSWLTRLGSALGLSSRAPKPSIARGRVVPDLSLWTQFQRVGGGLTPQQVSSIIRQADVGDMTRLMDLANDARQKDCHLQSVLQTAEESIAGLEWELALPDDAKASERRAAEWVTQVLKSTPDLTRLFAHHAGGRYYGYAVSEIEWARVAGRLVPARFEFLAPRRFGFNQQTGGFVWRDETMSQEGVDFRAQYPNRFIVSRPRVTGDVPCREGLVRVLMWAALFRNWSLSDWLKLGEIAWKPWRTGQYKKDNASEEDIANLVSILEGMTSSGVAVYPDSTTVNVEWPGGGSGGKTSAHSELFDKMGSEMSKAVLGQTLTTEQGKVGSQALGKVQNEVRKDLREAAARSVANDITRDLVAVLYALNFGESIRVAPFRFLTQDAVDLASFSTGVKNLKEAGARIPQSWVRDQVGIPEPEKGEECLGDVDIPIDPKTGLPSEPQDEKAPNDKPAPNEAA